jgi:hypothetical protein
LDRLLHFEANFEVTLEILKFNFTNRQTNWCNENGVGIRFVNEIHVLSMD